MSYVVARGDTISKVTDMLKISWQQLKRDNPHAVGRSSKNGNWFLKQGAVIQGKKAFESVLAQTQKPKPQSENQSVIQTPAKSPSDARSLTEYTIKSGDTLWELATKKFHVNIKDLIALNGIKNPRTIQPGRKIRIPTLSHPEKQEVVASWYGEAYHNRPMANGAIYNMYASTVAHRDLPFGTRLELENPKTGEKAQAVVTDRGPFIEGRDLDVSYGLAQKLSLVKNGVGPLLMRIVR